MNAKQYLGQIKCYERKIDQKKKEIQKIEAKISYIGGQEIRERVVTSPTNHLEKMMVEILDMKREIADYIYRYSSNMNKIIDEIQHLDKCDYIDVLYKRYVEGKSFEQISVDMCKSYYRTCHIHGEALREFEKKYSENLKVS